MRQPAAAKNGRLYSGDHVFLVFLFRGIYPLRTSFNQKEMSAEAVKAGRATFFSLKLVRKRTNLVIGSNRRL